jgi:hypothetical protein
MDLELEQSRMPTEIMQCGALFWSAFRICYALLHLCRLDCSILGTHHMRKPLVAYIMKLASN